MGMEPEIGAINGDNSRVASSKIEMIRRYQELANQCKGINREVYLRKIKELKNE